VRPVLDRTAFWLLMALIVWAPIPLGSNRPWAWALLETWTFAIGLLWIAALVRREVVLPESMLRGAAPMLVLLALWLSYLLLQWIPMPAGWVGWLSPRAAEVQAGAAYLEPGRRITLSLDPYATFDFWLKSCSYALAFVLTLLLVRRRRRLIWLCSAIVATGLLQAVYGSLMHLAGTDITVLGTPISHSNQASGSYVNRNHLAGLLEMSLAVGIGLMIAQLEDKPSRDWKTLARDTVAVVLSAKAALRVLLVVMVVALVMTRSRMGNTAFFVSLLTTGVAALALSRKAAPRGTVVLIVSLIAIDVLLVGAWFGVERTIQRIEQTSITKFDERGDASAYAMRMFGDYPAFGTGGGTFYTAFTRYRGRDIEKFFDHAHNDYVQVLSETGAIGAVLAGLAVLASYGCALLALARRRDPVARGVAFGVVMGTTSLAIHSAVDFNLQIPANALVFSILLALGWLSLYLGRDDRAY
jgi:putative inorganic carbon (hco3(-)) transporter